MAWIEAYSQQQVGFDRLVAVRRQVVRHSKICLHFVLIVQLMWEFFPQESVAVHHQEVQAATSIR